MSTTYLAGAALARLDVAQKQIDAHVHVRLGSCTTCGEPAPCHLRLTASAVFARYHRLPRRRPGLALRGVVRWSHDLHRARRPGWQCATCGVGWPCDSARKVLLEAYRGETARLGPQLAWCMAGASDDLAITDPTQLYPRFLGWLLDVNQRCRVCAKPRHDAIPGVPPRLVPCAGRVIDPVRWPALP